MSVGTITQLRCAYAQSLHATDLLEGIEGKFEDDASFGMVALGRAVIELDQAHHAAYSAFCDLVQHVGTPWDIAPGQKET